MNQVIILEGIVLDDFLLKIEEIIGNQVKKELSALQKSPEIKFMSRQETAKFLHITLPTLHHWTKFGYLKSYRIRNRVLYKSDEVISSLKDRKFSRG